MEKNSTNKIRFNVMAVILIIILCFAISPITLQNDTFYTIKVGEYIMQNGVTTDEPFSWHEGLKYTFPHWAYDVMIYLIFALGGQTGIYISTIILCAILGVLIYFVNCKLTKNRVTSFIITIAAMYLIKDFIAARAQLVTFVLFLLTFYFIEMFLETKKKRYAIGLIIIPILIANFHSATFAFYFVLYLPYIAEYIWIKVSYSSIFINKRKIEKLHKKIQNTNNNDKIETINSKIFELEKRIDILTKSKEKLSKNPYKVITKENKNVRLLIIIMIICLFTGFLTPHTTYEPYTHIIKLIKGSTTQNISEHLPLTLANNVKFACVLILFLMILIFTDAKIKLSHLFMTTGLLFLTFYTRRQESIFIIVCLPIFNNLICSMLNKYDNEGTEQIEKLMTEILGMIITISLVLIISIMIYKPKMNDKYINENQYPVEASTYILENLGIKNIKLYNEYNYGSYLLFRGIPVFIDSRADLYSPEFNEGANIFNDFLNISNLNITNIEEKFSEYGITHLIMYSNAKLRIFLRENDNDYIQLYDDEKFCIYKRVNSQSI